MIEENNCCFVVLSRKPGIGIHLFLYELFSLAVHFDAH